MCHCDRQMPSYIGTLNSYVNHCHHALYKPIRCNRTLRNLATYCKMYAEYVSRKLAVANRHYLQCRSGLVLHKAAIKCRHKAKQRFGVAIDPAQCFNLMVKFTFSCSNLMPIIFIQHFLNENSFVYSQPTESYKIEMTRLIILHAMQC